MYRCVKSVDWANRAVCAIRTKFEYRVTVTMFVAVLVLVSFLVLQLSIHGSKKFCQRGSNFDKLFFFSLMKEKDPNTSISGASTAHQ